MLFLFLSFYLYLNLNPFYFILLNLKYKLYNSNVYLLLPNFTFYIKVYDIQLVHFNYCIIQVYNNWLTNTNSKIVTLNITYSNIINLIYFPNTQSIVDNLNSIYYD